MTGVGALRQQVFELSDPKLSSAPPDVFGLWTTTLPLVEEGVTFDTSSPTQDTSLLPDMPTWRANLPLDLQQARFYLKSGTEHLEASHQVLIHLETRLDMLTRSGALPQPVADPSALTFSTAADTDRLASSLPVVLSDLQQDVPAANVDLGELLAGRWDEAAQQFKAVLDVVIRTATNYAWVETCLQKQVLARTSVGWTGDTNTIFQMRIAVEQMQLHQRTLAMALRSRAILIRTCVFAIQLAGSLGTGNPLIALPITWRYVNRLLAASGGG